MNAIEHAWTAFMAAIDEARDLNERGAGATELPELLRHARELLDIVESETTEQLITIPNDARAVLAQLRGRLGNLESQVNPAMH